jgi:miniconductance mechanosensitive channel
MQLHHLVNDYLVTLGTSETAAKYLNMAFLLVCLLTLAFSVDFIIRKIILKVFSKFPLKTKTNFDDLLVKNKTPRIIAHIIPLILVMELTPFVFVDFIFIELLVAKALLLFAIVLILWVVRSLLSTLKDYFKTLESLRDKPIDSYIQVFMIFSWVIGVLSAFAIVSGIAFIEFITTIGAASAVIILIFKDTILGFVASIQVSINDMVRIGDWVTFEKYGADGDITEINLSTVKVQNFDMTITTIPTYALISDSFQNWRGMQDSEGRRIKRALNIKMASIHYVTNEEFAVFKKIQSITTYLDTRQTDIENYNTKNNINKELFLNGRNLTNIGIFRKYVETYIENHSGIHKEMTLMVRQLAPGTQGIPIEIYAFSKDKRWENYEYIMADIFDHIIAAVPYFNLEVFELPSNTSFIDARK